MTIAPERIMPYPLLGRSCVLDLQPLDLWTANRVEVFLERKEKTQLGRRFGSETGPTYCSSNERRVGEEGEPCVCISLGGQDKFA